jgi:hypothetical protein
MSSILPFIGYRSWKHDAIEGQPRVFSLCDTDLSGSKTYSLNSLGFRGEEYDPSASTRIFFCGCSYTFGVGLNLEETAPYKFKMEYCAQLGQSADEVNLLNFAMPGASNDYIVRTLISQCSRVKPDVVVAIFSHIDRVEHIDEENLGKRTWTVAPWWVREAYPEMGGANTESAESYVETMRQASIGYFYYYTQSNGLWNFLQNALLLQSFCELNNIPYVFHWAELGRLSGLDTHFALSDMAQLLKKNHFLDVDDPQVTYPDRAADGMHPGPESNTQVAHALFNTFRAIYGMQR